MVTIQSGACVLRSPPLRDTDLLVALAINGFFRFSAQDFEREEYQ